MPKRLLARIPTAARLIVLAILAGNPGPLALRAQAPDAARPSTGVLEPFLVEYRQIRESRRAGKAERLEKFVLDLDSAVAPQSLDDDDWIDFRLLEADARLQLATQDLQKSEAARSRRERFSALLRYRHRVALSPVEVEDLGRRMMDATDKLLARSAADIDPKRSWREQLLAMKDDQVEPDDLVEFLRVEASNAAAFVVDHGLVTLPQGAKRLRIEPGDRDSLMPFGYYAPGSPGTFVAPPFDAASGAREEEAARRRDSHRRWLRVVTVHEAYPGHHVQMNVKLRPRERGRDVASEWLRSATSTTCLVEGWGLYSEELMSRHGYYDPATRLVQLQLRLMRAARAVIDVRMNTGSLKREEAAELLANRCVLTPVTAKLEVARYADNPTQPSSYILGFLDIERLRRDFLAAGLGTEREFHDRLLELGPIPLELSRAVLLGERGILAPVS